MARSTLRRWDGEGFVSGATLRRWDGERFIPDPGEFAASGGVALDVGPYRIHAFYATSSFLVTAGQRDLDVLLVGGGGAGSSGTAGGGAGGAVRTLTLPVTVGVYPINVGIGGAAPVSVTSGGSPGGSTSAFDNIAYGGGAGAFTTGGAIVAGTDGGNGGGSCWYSGQVGAPGHGIQGFDASQGYAMGSGGGFGGAGAGGTNPVDTRDGGPGLPNSWLGPSAYYGGGGGGSASDAPGAGGVGGGGAGAATDAVPGAANTGGGGGGGWYYANGFGKAGGSGLVLIRYIL